jgi:probable phosphoglycerate mutase
VTPQEFAPVAATVILIRHAACTDGSERLIGRAQAPLTNAGRRQADALAARLAGRAIERVQSSPQLRARQTAAAIAVRLGLAVEIVGAVDEIDLGAWTGRAFADLENDPDWRNWNARRGSSRPPDGENMAELRSRVIGHLTTLADDEPDAVVAVVSHAEPIRAAIMHYRGIPLDEFARVAVDHASCTELRLEHCGGEVVQQNQTIGALEPA